MTAQTIFVSVFGAANIDQISKTSATPVMGASNPGEIRHSVGGVGYNVAAVLARLGAKVHLATVIGADAGGATVREAARRRAIETAFMRTVSGETTATYQAILDHRGELIFGVAGMAIHAHMTPQSLQPAMAAGADHAYWVVDANLPEAAIRALVSTARDRRISLAALPVSPKKAQRFKDLLDQVTILFGNRKETAVLLGADPADPIAETAADLATRLADRHRLTAVITDGAAPLAVAADGTLSHFNPLPPIIVASVNGAGDALAAATLHGLACGRPLSEAILTGIAAASLTMEHPETLPDTLSDAALTERVRRLKARDSR